MSAWVYPDGWGEGSDPGDSVPDYGKDPYRVPESPKEIKRFLERARAAIRDGSLLILVADGEGSRSKNLDFMNLYGLWDSSLCRLGEYDERLGLLPGLS